MHQAMDSLTFSLLGNLLRKVGKKYGGGGRGRYLHKKDICFCTLQAPCLLAFFLLSLCWGGTEGCIYGFINPFPAGEFVLSALVPPEVSLKKCLRKPEPLILRYWFHTRWHKILELKQDVTDVTQVNVTRSTNDVIDRPQGGKRVKISTARNRITQTYQGCPLSNLKMGQTKLCVSMLHLLSEIRFFRLI